MTMFRDGVDVGECSSAAVSGNVSLLDEVAGRADGEHRYPMLTTMVK
jgi:hypothetical protein